MISIKKLFIFFFIFTLCFSISLILKSQENEIIFKISNKSFTSIDLNNRKNYLLFVGDNSSLSENEIINDFVSVNLFKKFYEISNLNNDNKNNINDTIKRVYKEIINVNSKDTNFNIKNFTKKNIIKNLELDLIRKLVLENLIKGQLSNLKNVNNNNNNIDMIYNYKIQYINLTLDNLNDYKNEFLNIDFKNLNNVEYFLNERNISHIKKENKINDMKNINKNILDNFNSNKSFFKIQRSQDVTYFSIKKEFQTSDTLSFVLYSIKSKERLNNKEIKCSLLENNNIESKEYAFKKLNEKIRTKLININDFVEINNENSFVYIILCDLKFNKDLINNIILNKKINKLVNDYEKNFIEKYSKIYNLILINE